MKYVLWTPGGTCLSVQDLIALVLLGVAFYTDLKYRKIYDKLNYPVMLIGLVLAALAGGWKGAAGALSGLGLAFAVFVLPCEIGAVGGGDAKLMMAFGALQGWRPMLAAVAGGFVLGGVHSFVKIARRPGGFKALAVSIASGSILHATIDDRAREDNIPLGVYLSLSAAACVVWTFAVGTIR